MKRFPHLCRWTALLVPLALLASSCSQSPDDLRRHYESEGDRLIDSADLIGSVTSVEADGFAVQPTETDGDIAMQAAEDNDAAGAGTRVQLGEDGSVERAVIDVASGAVTTTAASAADVQRGAYVAVFGDTQADGSILAMRVVIVQYAQATGEGGGDE